MVDIDCVIGGWEELASRLVRDDRLSLWADQEPQLHGLQCPADLRTATCNGADPSHADAILGALIRLAARDGGDDPDAVLTIVHLLRDGLIVLRRRLSDLDPEITAVLIGELVCQIRSFPWRRRRRAYASNLLLDTKRAVLRELRPHLRSVHATAADVLLDPTDPRSVAVFDARCDAGPDTDVDTELIDVLAWAASTSVASPADLRLLVELEYGRQRGGQREAVAARYGVCERTARRRRDRTLAALQAAGADYLAAVA